MTGYAMLIISFAGLITIGTFLALAYDHIEEWRRR